uniref:carbonic anhydrase n=1 Tax=Timema douglasi TaxID=61478 RepID=A0A7R8ZC36_TIMDO|nr:unnamed protein product [Timema douglasi]
MRKESEKVNLGLDPLIDGVGRISTRVGASYRLSQKVAPGILLPQELSRWFRYEGSLTTPSCDETVVWTVLPTSLPISRNQAMALKGKSLLPLRHCFIVHWGEGDPVALETKEVKLLESLGRVSLVSYFDKTPSDRLNCSCASSRDQSHDYCMAREWWKLYFRLEKAGIGKHTKASKYRNKDLHTLQPTRLDSTRRFIQCAASLRSEFNRDPVDGKAKGKIKIQHLVIHSHLSRFHSVMSPQGQMKDNARSVQPVHDRPVYHQHGPWDPRNTGAGREYCFLFGVPLAIIIVMV